MCERISLSTYHHCNLGRNMCFLRHWIIEPRIKGTSRSIVSPLRVFHSDHFDRIHFGAVRTARRASITCTPKWQLPAFKAISSMYVRECILETFSLFADKGRQYGAQSFHANKVKNRSILSSNRGRIMADGAIYEISGFWRIKSRFYTYFECARVCPSGRTFRLCANATNIRQWASDRAVYRSRQKLVCFQYSYSKQGNSCPDILNISKRDTNAFGHR